MLLADVVYDPEGYEPLLQTLHDVFHPQPRHPTPSSPVAIMAHRSRHPDQHVRHLHAGPQQWRRRCAPACANSNSMRSFFSTASLRNSSATLLSTFTPVTRHLLLFLPPLLHRLMAPAASGSSRRPRYRFAPYSPHSRTNLFLYESADLCMSRRHLSAASSFPTSRCTRSPLECDSRVVCAAAAVVSRDRVCCTSCNKSILLSVDAQILNKHGDKLWLCILSLQFYAHQEVGIT